jgi:hypothetical protein
MHLLGFLHSDYVLRPWPVFSFYISTVTLAPRHKIQSLFLPPTHFVSLSLYLFDSLLREKNTCQCYPPPKPSSFWELHMVVSILWPDNFLDFSPSTHLLDIYFVFLTGARAAKLLAESIPDDWRVIVIERNSHANRTFLSSALSDPFRTDSSPFFCYPDLYVIPRYTVVSGHEHKACK